MQLVALISNENVSSAQWLCGFIVTLEIQIQSRDSFHASHGITL